MIEWNKLIQIFDLGSVNLDVFDSSKERSKSTSSGTWFNFLLPSYRSRLSQFQGTFMDIPANEKLVDDFLCALHREILLQGRIYLAINSIAFYSNILGYETIVTLPYRDIKSINKATTIKLFLNAIEVVTNDGLKYFFTSFVSRDRAFKVMKLLWLNAISLQPTDRIEWSVICKLIQESYAISNVNLNKLEDSDLEDDLLKVLILLFLLF